MPIAPIHQTLPVPLTPVHTPKPLNSNVSLADAFNSELDHLLQLQLDSDECQVQDPDLMPTLDDWLLLHNYIFQDGKKVPDNYCNFRKLVDTFFQEPPPLRLIMCALAAYAKRDKLPANIALNFYKRGRKAVLRSFDRPSLRSVMAFYYINNFAIENGQPEIGKPFFVNALHQIVMLKMDIDPDDSPWLDHLNLTEMEKEERRRAYWACFYRLHLFQSMSTDRLPVQLRLGLVKPPQPIIDGDYEFSALPEVSSLAAIYYIITEIKTHYTSNIPVSLASIPSDPTLHLLSHHLHQIQTSIPKYLIFLPQSPYTFTPSDDIRFAQQIGALPYGCLSGLSQLNLAYHAATCLITRPTLYLSSLPLSTLPTLLQPLSTTILVNTWTQSLTAALTITTVARFFFTASTNPLVPPTLRTNTTPYKFTAVSLFESAVVQWFCVCRMHASNQAAVFAGFAVERVLGNMRDLGGWVRGFMEGGGDEALQPLVDVLEGMIGEVERVVRGRGRGEDGVRDLVTGRHVGEPGLEGVESVEVGMRVLSIGGDVGVEEIVLADPKVFLGLLGLEVGGVRWKGRGEKEWREFWRSELCNLMTL